MSAAAAADASRRRGSVSHRDRTKSCAKIARRSREGSSRASPRTPRRARAPRPRSRRAPRAGATRETTPSRVVSVAVAERRGQLGNRQQPSRGDAGAHPQRPDDARVPCDVFPPRGVPHRARETRQDVRCLGDDARPRLAAEFSSPTADFDARRARRAETRTATPPRATPPRGARACTSPSPRRTPPRTPPPPRRRREAIETSDGRAARKRAVAFPRADAPFPGASASSISSSSTRARDARLGRECDVRGGTESAPAPDPGPVGVVVRGRAGPGASSSASAAASASRGRILSRITRGWASGSNTVSTRAMSRPAARRTTPELSWRSATSARRAGVGKIQGRVRGTREARGRTRRASAAA